MKTKITILGTLMMAVVVTSYSVSGTYAKYVSEIDLADEARVAKWEIGLTDAAMKSVDLFQDSYDYVYVDSTDGSTKTNKEVVKTLDDLSVVDKNGNHVRVVAPGTKGQYTFALTGTIETNYKIKVTATGNNTVTTTYTDENDQEVAYDPIKFYVSDLDNVDIDTVDANDLLTFDELKTELGKLYSGTGNKVYAPGKVNNQSYTIYWKWDFDGVDKADTKLGEEIAQDTDSHKIDLSINIVAEQTRDAAN